MHDKYRVINSKDKVDNDNVSTDKGEEENKIYKQLIMDFGPTMDTGSYKKIQEVTDKHGLSQKGQNHKVTLFRNTTTNKSANSYRVLTRY